VRSPPVRIGPQVKNYERYNSSPISKPNGVPQGAPFLWFVIDATVVCMMDFRAILLM